MVSRLLVSIGVSSICWFWTWRSTCKPHLTAAHFEFFSNFIKYASVSHNPVLVVVGWPFLSYKFHTCICTYYMCCWNPDGHWHADSWSHTLIHISSYQDVMAAPFTSGSGIFSFQPTWEAFGISNIVVASCPLWLAALNIISWLLAPNLLRAPSHNYIKSMLISLIRA